MSEPPGLLPPRKNDSHKGDYGRVLCLGGSVGMSGAISLTGLAALRTGAGLVTVATARVCQPAVAAFHPCLMTIGLASDHQGRINERYDRRLHELCRQASCVAIGPGLSQSETLDRLVVDVYRDAPVPAVFDADALNALARHPDCLADAAGPRILTPHPGEFRRMINAGDIDRERMKRQAMDLAASTGTVMVLKGHRTLITDGGNHCENQTGNPGMATGGAGDVLTGVIAGLLAAGLYAYDAARTGAWLHGFAGDRVASRIGQAGLIASDLIEELPYVLKEIEAPDGSQP